MAAPLKLSGPMFDALEAFRQNDTDILPAYWIRVGTAVALMRRGLISAERFNRHQLTPEGARQLSIDYTIFVERAREQALAEDADRVACIAPGCDAVFTSGRRFSYDTDFTAAQRMQMHAAAAHVPLSVGGCTSLTKPLPPAQWESTRRYILGDPATSRLTLDEACGTVVAGPAPALQRTAEEIEFATAAMEPDQSFAAVLDWIADGIRGGLPIPANVSYVGSVVGVHIGLYRNRPNDLAVWARYAATQVVIEDHVHGTDRHRSRCGQGECL
jgi:hypothetical protein